MLISRFEIFDVSTAMAGNQLLQGEFLEKSLRMFEDVSDALDAHGVRFWLEGGTLLGVVREQRLLPWDTDIDLATTLDQAEPLRRALASLRKSGYRITVRNHAANEPPFPENKPRIVKIRDRRLWFFRGELLLDLFIKFRHEDRYYWAVGRGDNRVCMSSPAHFYDELVPIEFNGREYLRPKDIDNYLTYRYGNWKTPVKSWDCFKDDRAINENQEFMQG